MNFHSCFDWKSFGIDFENLAFEIYIPWKNENRFDLFEKRLHVDRTDIIRENFRANLPMMMMMENNQSIYLIEQENDLNSLQTANVTITFHHRVSDGSESTIRSKGYFISSLRKFDINVELIIQQISHSISSICLSLSLSRY